MRRNPLEWAILAVSVLSVLAIVGVLMLDLVAGPPEAPRLVVTVDAAAAEEDPGGWRVPVVVRNEGGSGVRGLVVECVAPVAGAEETSQLTVDLLGPDSEVRLVMAYRARPDGDVDCRALGFEVP